jgi:hypothetical protein
MSVKYGFPKELEWEGMNRIYLAQDKRRWRALVVAPISIQFQTKGKSNTPLQVCVKIFVYFLNLKIPTD